MTDKEFEIPDGGPPSTKARQWVQIEKTVDGDKSPYVDLEGLRLAIKSYKYPLHFIDFETNMVAIPFYEGQRPYEQVAFQFSHHQMNADGAIIHQDEYINTKRGEFPNFDFVRKLKAALEKDQGSIFRFAAHENTVLCQIKKQLEDSSEADKDNLISFIKTITRSPQESEEKWEGARCMIDMCELIKDYYYHPLMKNSNSIKKVLPAVLAESKYLQEKYSKPIYGAANGIKSHNYKDWTWIQFKDGNVLDPYKLLPNVFSDYDKETLDLFYGEESLNDGGSAMTAYARMQFSDMSETEAKAIEKALLKYCELDTLAMVMIYEYWKNLVK